MTIIFWRAINWWKIKIWQKIADTSFNYNENIRPSAADCSIQQKLPGKDDYASIPVSSTKINEQIADFRQKKHQQFNLFKQTARRQASYKNCTINDRSPTEIKDTRLADTCVMVGDSVITGINDKKLSSNLLIKLHDFWCATLADINHHISILNKLDAIKMIAKTCWKKWFCL